MYDFVVPKVSATEWIYVIQYRPVGAVKIGKSATESGVFKRVGQLLTSLPTDEADVLVVFESAMGTEKALHRRCADQNIKGEWFRIGPDVHDWLTALLEGDHLTIEGRRLVRRKGRQGIVGQARGRGPVVAADVRRTALEMLMDLARNADTEWVRLYASASLLRDKARAKEIQKRVEQMFDA